MAVQLNKGELASIAKMPVALQAQAREGILAHKAASQQEYLARPEVQARIVRNQANRENFRTAVSQNKPTVGCVYGLGSRFPVALHKGSWIKLIQNIEAIKAFVATLPDDKE